MNDHEFDEALEAAIGMQAATAPMTSLERPVRVRARLRKMLAEARKDPVAWTRANRGDVERASRRPLIARRLARDVPEFTEGEHAEFLTAYLADPETQVATVGAWDEEKKARWLKWIERAIPVLKVIAALTPPPWNVAVMVLIVVLTLVAERRLQPVELAGIFAPPPAGESVPSLSA